MKRITLLSTAFPYRGGIAHFAMLLFKELVSEFETKIITYKRQYPSLLFPGTSQFEPDDSAEPIPTERLLDSLNPFNWFRVGLKIQKDSPDILIINYFMPFFAPSFGLISKIVKKNNHTKIVVIAHNVIPHETKPGDKFFTTKFFKNVDYFILLSGSVQNDLLGIKPSAKYLQLFHPVYSMFGDAVEKTSAKEWLKIKSEKVILFFGFIREYKGLDVLIEAVSLLKGKLKLKVIVAGEFYSNPKKYSDLIEEYSLTETVLLFNDFIPTQEVKQYFSAADVVVLPYKDATQSGIVQIANNFCKPVIATRVGGLSEIINDGETGFVVEPNNPEAIAKAIIKFYEDECEEKFSDNIKNELEKYSWANFTKQMIEFVEK